MEPPKNIERFSLDIPSSRFGGNFHVFLGPQDILGAINEQNVIRHLPLAISHILAKGTI